MLISAGILEVDANRFHFLVGTSRDMSDLVAGTTATRAYPISSVWLGLGDNLSPGILSRSSGQNTNDIGKHGRLAGRFFSADCVRYFVSGLNPYMPIRHDKFIRGSASHDSKTFLNLPVRR